MKLILFSVIIASLGVNLLNAQSDSYSSKVKLMMQLNGSEGTFKVAVSGMIDQMKNFREEVPEEVWNEMEKDFMATSMKDLATLLTPVYHRHLTEKDLDLIIEFYKSAAGQKLAEKTPDITQESMEIGRIWGLKMGEDLARKLEERGY